MRLGGKHPQPVNGSPETVKHPSSSVFLVCFHRCRGRPRPQILSLLLLQHHSNQQTH
uniref:Uncharacterized protein n=1 Tax=Rhizophora mucronata TaxID=61149 RepID=A0A2P2LVL7_RHIMU